MAVLLAGCAGFLARQQDNGPAGADCQCVTEQSRPRGATGQQRPYSAAKLGALAEHCIAQEDAAQTVERRMHKSVAALLLEPHVGRQADANVTDGSESGLGLRIFAPPAGGRLESSLRRFEVGLQVRVKLVSTDVGRGFIDFAAVD